MMMTYNNLPGTSVKVSRISLGTMMFGGQASEADSLSIMDCAYERGVTFWDTAQVYNEGESERIVGLGMQGRRENIICRYESNGAIAPQHHERDRYKSYASGYGLCGSLLHAHARL